MISEEYILVYDTSANACNVGLFCGERLISHDLVECQYGHAEHIIDLINRLVEDTKIDFQDLRKIYTTKGPGSFTGIRVGLSVAKMLELTLNIPCIGIDSFSIASVHYLKHVKKAAEHLVVLETRKAEFFVQHFDSNGNVKSPAKTVFLEGIKAKFPENIVLTGDGVPKLENNPDFQNYTKISQPPYFEIQDIYTAGLQLEEKLDDPLISVEPFYLAPPKVTLKKIS